MRRISYRSATAAVSLLAVFSSQLHIAASDLAQDQKMLWSCYMVCWPLNRSYQEFVDRPLDRPTPSDAAGRLLDLRHAVEAGVDAFSVDLFISDKGALAGFGQLLDLIHKHRLPLQLSPMFDGLASPGVTLNDVFIKLRRWFEKFAQDPAVPRFQGKPVLYTLAAGE